jgi:phosphoglycerate-specific signal transduction histidine kinase
MNNNLIQDFISKIRQNIESLSLEINKTPIDTKETLNKTKQTKNDLTHVYNLLKIEENIQETNASNR